MASKLKRGAPGYEASERSSKRRGGSTGNEGLLNIGGNLHPLFNPLVLETLFLYSTGLEEVKRNRLVCSVWFKACESQWTMLTKTLTLFRNEASPQRTSIPSDEVIMTLLQLWEICDGTNSALEKVGPYRKFKFQNWTFDSHLLHILNTINEPITTTDRWLWNRIAPSMIKSLTLESCHFPVRFMPFEECLLRALPNLETFSVINCTSTRDILRSAASEWCVRVRQRVPREEEQEGHWANLNFTHQKLKNVHLHVSKQNYQHMQTASLIPLSGLVPNLERFRIGGVHPTTRGNLLRVLVGRLTQNYEFTRLRELHLLDFSSKTHEDRTFNEFNAWGDPAVRFNNLEDFQFDVGYAPEAEGEMTFIAASMPVLKKLNLYRAPLSQPLPFPNLVQLQRLDMLTELHLWGNVSSSFQFLNALPKLRVLKWVTSCYEEKFHGYRVTSALEESEQLRTYPLLLKDVIDESEVVSTMEHLTTFELDSGPISTTSWKRLGEWMPNLKNLKAIVSRVEHLGIIREQWKQLETLELAHGSKLPGGKLLKELVKFDGTLKKFQWKGCACTRKLYGKGVVSGLQEVENRLGSQLPEKCTFPWNANLEDEEANVCKQAAFEEYLMSRAVSATEWSG